MRNEIDRIVSLLHQTYDGTPYYGPSLCAVLQEVDSATAARRPVGARHTIWDIVAHVAAELRYAVALLDGTAGPWVDGQTTWPAVQEVSDEAWGLALDELRGAHQSLLEAISRLGDSDLDLKAGGVGTSFYVLLHGVNQHSAYHAGQMRLLARQATAVPAPDRSGDRGRAIELIPFQTRHADDVVAMWRRSFEAALGIVDPHPISEQWAYLLDVVVPANRILLALDGQRVVAFVAASDERLDLLYVDPDYQGKGIGSRLLQWAKDQSSGRLSLFTFERNQRAQHFYEARGFKVVGRGFEEHWQLPDVAYEWCAAAPDAYA
jgi:GNAT superfamily N-acetyltransferase/uncharacterized damage-inducible protein DinB